MDDKIKDVVETVSDVTNVAKVVSPKKWTWKKVLLSIVTLYFVIILLKWLAIGIWKLLGLVRRYIHDITNEQKWAEVMFWTITGLVVGIFLGIFFKDKFLEWYDSLGNFWRDVVLPWIYGA